MSVAPAVSETINYKNLLEDRPAMVRHYAPKKSGESSLHKTVIAALEESLPVGGTISCVIFDESLAVDVISDEQWQREQRLNYYLSEIYKKGDIKPETARFAWNAWKHLRKVASDFTKKSLPVPDAAPGPNGELLYTWNKNEHHLELEFFPEGVAELFYANRASGELWETAYEVDIELSQEAKQKLNAVT